MDTIKELREKLDKKEVTSEELFARSNELAHKYQSDFNSFVTIIDEYKHTEGKSLIDGIPMH